MTEKEFLLFEQSLNFVHCYLTFHVARDDVDDLFWSDTFYVEACHGTGFYFLICQHADLLLRVVEKAHGTVRTSNRDEIFDSSYRVRHSLSNLNIAVETICNFFENFHVHKLALGLMSLQVCFLLVDVFL